jgi:hypothetical protein
VCVGEWMSGLVGRSGAEGQEGSAYLDAVTFEQRGVQVVDL